ncbi:MAG TPA: acryloyl-CoA reductase [Pirellulales bacterium]
MIQSMRCLLVTKEHDGAVMRAVTTRPTSELPDGDVLVRVLYSSLNFKDALAATGHPGVAGKFPHVPGIDAAGIVAETASSKFNVGDEVIVTSFELGAGRWGGYAEFVRVPADWVVPLPSGLTLRESMILGTAGLTAAMSLEVIERQGIRPTSGDMVVTGASGGVGTLAVAMFAKLGYRVVAISGKPAAIELLGLLGAAEVLSRESVNDTSSKPMLKTRWSAAVDTVGGNVLATLLRSMKHGGCVAACGLVGGSDLLITVYPFILRGVMLAGIDSGWYPAERRSALWQKMATIWKPKLLNELATEVHLMDLEPKIQEILAGKNIGRIVVKISDG